jgi:predicted hotdog family 3-hydroxylacyl-ACP dehydratase
MCLLDRIVAYTEQDIECRASTHSSPENPLRRDGELSALHLIEYAAQAMAAHGALVSGGIQRGMLAAVRDLRLHVGRIDDIDAELDVRATRRITQTTGSIYDFSIRGNGRMLCEGRIAIAFS